MEKEFKGQNLFNIYWGFLVSIITYFILVSINSWGDPRWIKSLSLSSYYYLIKGLIIYSLSCLLFFGMAFLLKLRNRLFRIKWLLFLISFSPCIIFSYLVINYFTFEDVDNLLGVFSIVSWLVISFLSIEMLIFSKKAWIHSYTPLWLTTMTIFGILSLILHILSEIKILPGTLSYLILITLFIVLSTLAFINGFPFKSHNKELILTRILTDYDISPREKEVLLLLVKGKTNDEIANELYISLSTVKTHIRNLFTKTNSRNRIELSNLLNPDSHT